MAFHISKLTEEFERRLQKNPRYSLRAYAASLDLHPSALSRILAGKQDLSPKSSVSIVKKLKLSDDEQRLFMQAVIDTRHTKETLKVGAQFGSESLRPKPIEIGNEVYAQIARLPCLAVLALAHTKDFDASCESIAKRLGLSVAEASQVVEVLTSVGLLRRDGDTLVNHDLHATAVDNKASSDARKNQQREILHAASVALDDVAFERRAHYGMTMAIDPANLDKVRTLIMEFMESLSDTLESGQRTEVYQLGVQLFPLTKDKGEST